MKLKLSHQVWIWIVNYLNMRLIALKFTFNFDKCGVFVLFEVWNMRHRTTGSRGSRGGVWSFSMGRGEEFQSNRSSLDYSENQQF